MNIANVVAPATFGTLFLGVGIWQLIATYKYFKNLKSGKTKSKSGFVGYAVWASLMIGIVFTIFGLGTVISALINLIK